MLVNTLLFSVANALKKGSQGNRDAAIGRWVWWIKFRIYIPYAKPAEDGELQKALEI